MVSLLGISQWVIYRYLRNISLGRDHRCEPRYEVKGSLLTVHFSNFFYLACFRLLVKFFFFLRCMYIFVFNSYFFLWKFSLIRIHLVLTRRLQIDFFSLLFRIIHFLRFSTFSSTGANNIALCEGIPRVSKRSVFYICAILFLCLYGYLCLSMLSFDEIP